MASRLLQRLQHAIPFAAAANSVYLTAVFIRAFFSEAGVAPRVDDFAVPFYFVPAILVSLLLISNVRRKTYIPRKGRLGSYFFLTLPIYFFQLVFLAGCLFFLWRSFAGRAFTSIEVAVSLLAEIIAISFAVGAEKMKRIGKVVGLIFAWGFSVIAAFTVVGVFEELHPGIAVSNELRLVFSGIFFHACNTVYLLYTGIERANSYSSKMQQNAKLGLHSRRQAPTA